MAHTRHQMDTEVWVQLLLPRGLLVLICPLLCSRLTQTYGPCTLLGFQRKPSNPTPSTMIPRETEAGDMPSAAPPQPPYSASGVTRGPAARPTHTLLLRLAPKNGSFRPPPLPRTLLHWLTSSHPLGLSSNVSSSGKPSSLLQRGPACSWLPQHCVSPAL